MDSDDLEHVIRHGLIGTKFEPVHDNVTGSPAGYVVTPFRRDIDDCDSDRLRESIQLSDHTGDYDSSIRGIALRDAENAGITQNTRLFFSAEPESLVTLEERPDSHARSMILKLDHTSVRDNPAAVLRSIRSARQMGWGIGIRNVGLDLESLSFIPLINPSIVGLHPDVLRIEDRAYLSKLTWLLQSHIERTSGVIFARGVRDERDVDLAEQMGVRLISGPFFGPGTETPEPLEMAAEDYLADHYTRNKQVQGTPYSISQSLGRDPLITSQDLLLEEIRSLLERAKHAGPSAVVVVVHSSDECLDPTIGDLIRSIAPEVGVLASVSGESVATTLPNIMTGPLDSSDPLRNEYGVVVVSSDWSAMITAHRLARPGAEGRTDFETYFTTDRFACVDGARAVLSRLASRRNV